MEQNAHTQAGKGRRILGPSSEVPAVDLVDLLVGMTSYSAEDFAFLVAAEDIPYPVEVDLSLFAQPS